LPWNRRASEHETHLFEQLDHLCFGGQKHQQASTASVVACSATDTVNVGVDVLGAVDLDHPVDSRKVETSRRNIGGEQHGLFQQRLAR